MCPSPGHLPEKGADSARSSVLRGFEDVCVGWIMAWALSKCILYIVVVHTSEANISNISPTMSYIYKTNSIFHVLMRVEEFLKLNLEYQNFILLIEEYWQFIKALTHGD